MQCPVAGVRVYSKSNRDRSGGVLKDIYIFQNDIDSRNCSYIRTYRFNSNKEDSDLNEDNFFSFMS